MLSSPHASCSLDVLDVTALYIQSAFANGFTNGAVNKEQAIVFFTFPIFHFLHKHLDITDLTIVIVKFKRIKHRRKKNLNACFQKVLKCSKGKVFHVSSL